MTAGVPSQSLRRGIGVVGPALVVASGLGYALFISVGRILAPSDFATFAAFWGLLFGGGSVLGAVEQETARLVAWWAGQGRAGAEVRNRTLLVAVGFAGLLLVLGAASFPVTVTRVLHGSWALYGVAAVAVLGFAVQFAVRGTFAGSGHMGRYASVIVVEALLRVLVLGGVILLGRRDLLWCGVAVAAGSFAWLFVPSARRGVARVDIGDTDGVGPRSLALPVLAGDIGRLVLAGAFTAVVITGYPALAAAAAPADERSRLGVLLAALTLTRIPLLLLGPLQAVLVPELVRRTRRAGWPPAARLLRQAVAGIAAVGLVGVAAALAWGPPVIRLLYGDRYDIGNVALAVMTVGATLTAAVLVLAAGLVSTERHDWVVVTWGVCLLGVLLTFVFPAGTFFDRAVAALVVGPALGLVIAVCALASPNVLAGRGRRIGGARQ